MVHIAPRGQPGHQSVGSRSARTTRQLGLPGKNINEDIAALVTRGLNPDIQQALDTVRVIGKNAVHPLEMDVKDNRQVANALFSLVTFISDQMITFPAKRAAMFASLPQNALASIAKRDGPQNGPHNPQNGT